MTCSLDWILDAIVHNFDYSVDIPQEDKRHP